MKHGVNEVTLRHKASDGAWNKRRKKVREKNVKKIDEKIANAKASEVVKSLDVARYTAQCWQETLKNLAALVDKNLDLYADDLTKVAAMSTAINRNIDSLYKSCRILSVQEERRLQLEERKLAL